MPSIPELEGTYDGATSAALTGGCARPEPSDIRDFTTDTTMGADDRAIFIEDTFDEGTVRRLGASPSASAILSPAKGYDEGRSCSGGDDTCGGSALRGAVAGRYHRGGSSSAKKHRPHRTFAFELTNSALSTALFPRKDGAAAEVRGPQGATAAKESPAAAPVAAPAKETMRMVPLAEFERLEREARRYERMYVHQRSMAELSEQRTTEAQQKLQEKIVEVVALSTRNEESKRFIRQLKREMLDCKTRTLDLHNRAINEKHSEQRLRERFTHLLETQREEFAERVEAYEKKITSLERLVADLTSVGGSDCSLESLLKASYAKSHALYCDVRRARQEYELLVDRKAESDRQVDQLRRERRETEQHLAHERRRSSQREDEFEAEIHALQETVVELRQDLVEALARRSPGSTASYASNECATDNDDESHSNGSFEREGDLSNNSGKGLKYTVIAVRQHQDEISETPYHEDAANERHRYARGSLAADGTGTTHS